MKKRTVALYIAGSMCASIITGCVAAQVNGPEEPKIDWVFEINNIAADNSLTIQEKVDTVESMAHKYKTYEDEVVAFESDIIAAYESGAYVGDAESSVPALTNIFKSEVVADHYDGLTDEFASSFHDVVKDVYTGAVEPNSSQTEDAAISLQETLTKMK